MIPGFRLGKYNLVCSKMLREFGDVEEDWLRLPSHLPQFVLLDQQHHLTPLIVLDAHFRVKHNSIRIEIQILGEELCEENSAPVCCVPTI